MKKSDTDNRKPPTLYEVECGQRMKFIAESRRLTQAEVADALGVSVGMVSHYYNGRKPVTIKRLSAFCRLAKCSSRDVDPKGLIEDHLSSEERVVVDALRASDPAKRQLLVDLLLGSLQKE